MAKISPIQFFRQVKQEIKKGYLADPQGSYADLDNGYYLGGDCRDFLFLRRSDFRLGC